MMIGGISESVKMEQKNEGISIRCRKRVTRCFADLMRLK